MIFKDCFNQLTQLIEQSKHLNKIGFFYTPPGDHNHYHITCELLQKTKGQIGFLDGRNDINHYFDHTFYYQLGENNFKMSCCLVSQSLIFQLYSKYTNLHFVNKQKEYLIFSDVQRKNLEYHLKKNALNFTKSLRSKL
jgi:hypothetical protein